MALLGPNGAGKTTLLHLAVGLIKPQSGEVRVFGEPRKRERDFFEVRGRIGLLYQDSDDQLFCPTVEEDVAFGPLNQGKTRHEAGEIVRGVMERLGLIDLRRRLTHTLSGGEKRLAALASVLAMNPECLLLDEPAAGLDEETADRIVEYLANSDLTYVAISHDADFLKRTTNKAVRLKDGKIETAAREA